jgi:hypothetical protein
MVNQQAETLRINAAFDVELARLRAVWVGAAPGSMGPMPKASGAATPSRGGAAASASAKPKP